MRGLIYLCSTTGLQKLAVVKKKKSSLVASAKGLKAARAPDSRNGRGSTVIGKAIGIHIRAAKRIANIFVTRLDPDLSCDELAVYIEQTLSIRPTVERVKATSSYASFHLTCECQDPAVLLDACILVRRKSHFKWNCCTDFFCRLI